MTNATGDFPRDLDIVVPVYREAPEVLDETLRALLDAVAHMPAWEVTIVVVNDGSPESFDYRAVCDKPGVKLLNLPENRGYGGAIKAGLRQSRATWVAITDADGTYPNHRFPDLVPHLDTQDMVVGARITSIRNIPWVRRLPKYLLTRYASFLAAYPIPDLNSGMRVFRRARCMEFWAYYPNGFSFTSTITMAFLAMRYGVDYVPIDYFKREGKSTMRPIQDTKLFFQLVGRMGLYFNPLRVFGPFAVTMVMLGVLKGGRDYALEGHVGNLAVTFWIAGLQIYLMGLLGELIVRRRS